MSILHIANSCFEEELENPASSIEESIQKNRVALQLQFLPLLYGDEKDGVAVTHYPPAEYLEHLKKNGLSKIPQIHLLSEKTFPYRTLESWGASLQCAAWAHAHHLAYSIPSWGVVREVNSKAFSFTHSPCLPNACLLYSWEQVEEWVKKPFFPKVLKTCFGVSGKGHHLIAQGGKIEKAFVEKEFKKGLPLIGEPWVTRVLDFSTQWKIAEEQTVSFLGVTVCENSPRGMYRGNTVDDPEPIFGSSIHFFQEHLSQATAVLKRIAELKYSGHVGVDAYLFQEKEKIRLHPVSEINARKTMGWVLLKIQEKYFPERRASYRFSKRESAFSLLPHTLQMGEKTISFTHQLEFIR